MNLKKLKKGFTLVELVVVIAVIAILTGASVGAYFGITNSANESKIQQEGKQVKDLYKTRAILNNDASKSIFENIDSFDDYIQDEFQCSGLPGTNSSINYYVTAEDYSSNYDVSMIYVGSNGYVFVSELLANSTSLTGNVSDNDMIYKSYEEFLSTTMLNEEEFAYRLIKSYNDKNNKRLENIVYYNYIIEDTSNEIPASYEKLDNYYGKGLYEFRPGEKVSFSENDVLYKIRDSKVYLEQNNFYDTSISNDSIIKTNKRSNGNLVVKDFQENSYFVEDNYDNKRYISTIINEQLSEEKSITPTSFINELNTGVVVFESVTPSVNQDSTFSNADTGPKENRIIIEENLEIKKGVTVLLSAYSKKASKELEQGYLRTGRNGKVPNQTDLMFSSAEIPVEGDPAFHFKEDRLNYTPDSIFCTNELIVSNGITLTVNGKLIVSACVGLSTTYKDFSLGSGLSSSILGYFSCLTLNTNSQVINNGETIVNGLVYGEGNFINNNQLQARMSMKWASASTALGEVRGGVFPFNNYHFDSIRSNLIVNNTSSVNALAVIYGDRVGFQDTTIPLIGPTKDYVFQLTKNSMLTKKYKEAANESESVEEYIMEGDMIGNAISLKVSSVTLDLSNLLFPINYMNIFVNGTFNTNNLQMLILEKGSVTLNNSDSRIIIDSKIVNLSGKVLLEKGTALINTEELGGNFDIKDQFTISYGENISNNPSNFKASYNGKYAVTHQYKKTYNAEYKENISSSTTKYLTNELAFNVTDQVNSVGYIALTIYYGNANNNYKTYYYNGTVSECESQDFVFKKGTKFSDILETINQYASINGYNITKWSNNITNDFAKGENTSSRYLSYVDETKALSENLLLNRNLAIFPIYEKI